MKATRLRLHRAVLTLKPVQRQHPPLWIAASGDPAVERAAKHGDAWLINPHASLPTLERQMALYRRTLAAAGRTFPADAPILKEFRIAATRRQALEESKAYLEPKYRAYADWGLDKPMPKEESPRRHRAARPRAPGESLHLPRAVARDAATGRVHADRAAGARGGAADAADALTRP